MDENRGKKQGEVLSYIKHMLVYASSDNMHVKRNAGIQIWIVTVAFILLVRVFPMGSIQDHTYSRQGAFDKADRETLTGEVFTARDKKLQTVYFQEDHIFRITLYMNCREAGEGVVLFRLYNDSFSCIYEEQAGCSQIESQGYLRAAPDLDIEKDQPYYYEVLIPEETDARFELPVADRGALGQHENSTLYIDGIINDEVCLIADFDYTSPLSVGAIVFYDVLIVSVALALYLFANMAVSAYDERFGDSGAAVGRAFRVGGSVLTGIGAVACLVFSVILNGFGGEIWDRLFFLAGILAGAAWLLAAIWIPARNPRQIPSQNRTVRSRLSLIWRNYIQTVSFGLLFCALCQYVNADRMFYQYTNTRWMLIFLAIALLMNYNERQFVNKFSGIWLVLGLAGSLFYCKRVGTDENKLLLARLTCGVVVSWGLLALNILFVTVRAGAVSGENIVRRIARQVRGHRQQTLYIALWVVFSLLMYANRYEKVWVFTATLPFVALLFAPDTLSAKCRFLKNFSDGILLCFALVTAFCLAHRPHHYWMLYRYGGIFHTVACTGMYLVVVFGAALARLYGKLKTRRSMLRFCLLEYFMTACVAGFILLTMSRTAFLTTAVTAVAVAAVTAAAYHKKPGRILAEFGVLAAVCLVSFPMVYTAVRMVPAVVNDPVRYDIELQDRGFIIYEGDPIDSDKYMTVRRFFSTLFGRFQTSGSGTADTGSTEGVWRQEAGELAFTGDGLAGLGMRRFAGVYDAVSVPDEEDGKDISNGRFVIFGDYIKAIGFKGHPKMGPLDKNGDEYAHAHNSYLQVAYNFGLIAGILFLALCALALWRSIRFSLDHGGRYGIVFVPFALVVVFGFVSLTEWAYHPCIPAGFSFILMQVVLMRTDTQGR